MYKILIFIVIIIISILISLYKIENNKLKCVKPIYKVSKLTYSWHITGLCICLAMFSLIFYAEMTGKIVLSISPVIFVILLGFLSSACLYGIVMYSFTPVGIYENGILTHFFFLPLEEIEAFKIDNVNLLNTGSNKTIIFKIKKNAFNHPSLEIRAKDEKKMDDILKEMKIKEASFNTSK